MALTRSKKAFADEYIKRKCRNGTEAAKAAGYSEKSAYGIAYNLLQEEAVKEYIEEKLKNHCLSANETLSILSDQAKASIEDFIDLGPDETRIAKLEAELEKYAEKAMDISVIDKVRDFAQSQVNLIREEISVLLNRDYRINLEKAAAVNKLHLVKGLKPTPNGLGLELHDAHAAAVDIGRFWKLFGDRNELTGKDGKDLFDGSLLDSRITGLSSPSDKNPNTGELDGEGEA